MIGLEIVGGIVLVLVIALVVLYNGLVRGRRQCQEAWADVDTELKRRYELIPNLVATVKGYAQHERQLLEEVTRLREECVRSVGSPRAQAASENRLVHALDRLMVRVEQYPALKASENFLALQKELVNTEDRIQAARRFYNGNVRDYNIRTETFPSVLVANAFDFKAAEFFEIDAAVREAPRVSL